MALLGVPQTAKTWSPNCTLGILLLLEGPSTASEGTHPMAATAIIPVTASAIRARCSVVSDGSATPLRECVCWRRIQHFVSQCSPKLRYLES